MRPSLSEPPPAYPRFDLLRNRKTSRSDAPALIQPRLAARTGAQGGRGTLPARRPRRAAAPREAAGTARNGSRICRARTPRT